MRFSIASLDDYFKQVYDMPPSWYSTELSRDERRELAGAVSVEEWTWMRGWHEHVRLGRPMTDHEKRVLWRDFIAPRLDWAALPAPADDGHPRRLR